MQGMVRQVPGERTSCFGLCGELTRLAQEQPMAHPLWDAPKKMASGPPRVKSLAPEAAADIAGKGGYATGMRVQVFNEGEWATGTVERISGTLCPGAAQVHFVQGGLEKAVLVCPWQFPEVLRPLPEHKGRLEAFPTMVFASDAAMTPEENNAAAPSTDLLPTCDLSDLPAGTGAMTPNVPLPSGLAVEPLGSKVLATPKSASYSGASPRGVAEAKQSGATAGGPKHHPAAPQRAELTQSAPTGHKCSTRMAPQSGSKCKQM